MQSRHSRRRARTGSAVGSARRWRRPGRPSARRRRVRGDRPADLVEHVAASVSVRKPCATPAGTVERGRSPADSSIASNGGRSAPSGRRSSTTSNTAPRDAAHQLGPRRAAAPGSACRAACRAAGCTTGWTATKSSDQPGGGELVAAERAREGAALVLVAARRRPRTRRQAPAASNRITITCSSRDRHDEAAAPVADGAPSAR